MKDFNDYKTKLSFPTKKEFTTVYVYERGNILHTGSLVEWQNGKCRYFDEKKTMVEEYFDKTRYDNAKNAFYANQRQLDEEFKQDLFEEFGVTDNVKVEKAYGLAYERGHSYGFSEIYNEFEELVDLIK